MRTRAMKLQRYVPIIEIISNRAEITMAKSDNAPLVKADEAEAEMDRIYLIGQGYLDDLQKAEATIKELEEIIIQYKQSVFNSVKENQRLREALEKVITDYDPTRPEKSYRIAQKALEDKP